MVAQANPRYHKISLTADRLEDKLRLIANYPATAISKCLVKKLSKRGGGHARGNSRISRRERADAPQSILQVIEDVVKLRAEFKARVLGKTQTLEQIDVEVIRAGSTQRIAS